MIYFLKLPTGKVAIRYYRIRDHYESFPQESGEKILRIEEGGREKAASLHERFARYLNVTGTRFYLKGELLFYLYGVPHEQRALSVKGVASMYAISRAETRSAMRALKIRKLAEGDAERVYTAARKAQRLKAAWKR